MKLDELLSKLNAETIDTWFDLGLFLDRLKEERDFPPMQLNGSFDDLKEELRCGGIGLLSFHYMVDGVTVEAEKYASLLKRNIPGAN